MFAIPQGALPEQKRREGVQTPPPGLPFVCRAGRNVDVAVGDSGGGQLLLVRPQTVGVLHRPATHEEDLDLLIELRRYSHLAVVNGLEVERNWRRRSGGCRSGARSS